MMLSETPGGIQTSAVLLSGGLDSAVLVAHETRTAIVQPVYVSVGLAWEANELAAIARLTAAAPFGDRVRPIERLSFNMLDVYAPSHWAVRGTPPAYDTPDEDVYLAGRNIVLLAKAAVFCAGRGIGRMAIGPLAGNPFPDATPEFFAALARALALGLAHDIRIEAPFATLHKADVIRLGRLLGVPLELTLSCMNPLDGLHCGQCSKCRERRDAFAEAGVEDATRYRAAPPR